MLQAWILRLRILFQSKVVLAASLGFLIAIGMSYYIIDKNQNNGRIFNIGTYDKQPAAQEPNVVVGSANIVIDISGAVEKPGLYKLMVSSRVGDAVNAAGGISKDASLEYISKNLNLAQKLEDTQKIYVPFEWDLYENEVYDIQPLVVKTGPSITVSSQPSTANLPNNPVPDSSGKTNANKASLEDLDKLSGIGPVYAQKIVDNRPYKDYIELSTKSGIPKSTLEKIKDLVSY